MGLKGTKIYSILTGTCPVCHSGKMYKNKNPYIFSDTLKMHDNCPNCGVKFKIEPSFFYGAMYVSYAVGVALAIAVFTVAYFFIGLNRMQTFLTIVVMLILMLPIILRVSRNIWINFFFKYDKGKI